MSEKMESRLCSGWIYLWTVILLGIVSCSSDTAPSYVIHLQDVTFDEALQDCSPDVLATLATTQDATNILKHFSSLLSSSETKSFIFWVGLRKAKFDCIVPELPLRGFTWVDGSQEAELIHWKEEPQPTCTAIRCAALEVVSDGSSVPSGSLISRTCKTRFPYICKQRDKQAGEQDSQPEREMVPTASQFEQTHSEPEPELDPGADLGSDLCPRPFIPGARSLSMDPGNSSRIMVVCWSGVRLELRCSGRPAVWQWSDSPIDLSAVCPCRDGFQREASGNCVDIDECRSSTTCKHICLNTAGSYHCICYDKHGNNHSEYSVACTNVTSPSLNQTDKPSLTTPTHNTSDNSHVGITDDSSSWLAGILMPVLIGVLVLVLLVFTAVAVKCCLMRCSKKHAMKKEEKTAMRSKDTASKESYETANEKEGT